MSIVFEFVFSLYFFTYKLVVMFAHLTSTLHAPSVAHLEKGQTSPALPTGTSTSTVTVPDALAGHPQLKASGQHATQSKLHVPPGFSQHSISDGIVCDTVLCYSAKAAGGKWNIRDYLF